MPAISSDEGREWAADKRDFIADSRDDIADGREATADKREATANHRESELDAWERRLEALAAEFRSRTGERDATKRARANRGAGDAREADRSDRIAAGHDRDEANVRRAEAGQRRRENNSSALAFAFATIAEQLYQAEDYSDALSRIARVAVETVAGCNSASITLRQEDGYLTAATTSMDATAVDQAQYNAGEGPCLDAINVPLVHAPAFPDDRWPVLGAQPTVHGVHSSVSYQLRDASGSAGAGSLNAYAVRTNVFDEAAQHIGLVLAVHASLAARAVGDRAALTGLKADFQAALSSREVIGEAKGILIERLRITPEKAFEILRTTSQRLNVKLRELALTLTETGEFNPPDDRLPN